MDTPVIREAQLTDLPELRRLFQVLCESHPAPYPTFDESAFDAFVRTLAPGLVPSHPRTLPFGCFVAQTPTGLLGFIAVEVGYRAIGTPNVFILPHYLVTDPAHRRQGIARALIARAIQWSVEFCPAVQDIELFAIQGDDQWARRGWTPFLVKYHRTLQDFLASTDASRDSPMPDVVASSVSEWEALGIVPPDVVASSVPQEGASNGRIE